MLQGSSHFQLIYPLTRGQFGQEIVAEGIFRANVTTRLRNPCSISLPEDTCYKTRLIFLVTLAFHRGDVTKFSLRRPPRCQPDQINSARLGHVPENAVTPQHYVNLVGELPVLEARYPKTTKIAAPGLPGLAPDLLRTSPAALRTRSGSSLFRVCLRNGRILAICGDRTTCNVLCIM